MNKELILQRANKFVQSVEYGDNILTEGHVEWKIKELFKCIERWIGYTGIQIAQVKLLTQRYKKSEVRWQDTHITKYFGTENVLNILGDRDKIRNIVSVFELDDTKAKLMSDRIFKEVVQNYKDMYGSEWEQKIQDPIYGPSTFSVEPPVATFIPVISYVGDDINIIRYQKKVLDNWDISKLIEGTVPMIGTKYDYGQLVSIAINLLNYAPDETYYFMDFGSSRKVCSVGVFTCEQYHKQRLEKEKGIMIPRSFSKLNINGWSTKFFDRFYDKDKRGEMSGRWNAEMIYPDMYRNNNTHFDNEWLPIPV